ncbi:MAG: hypothetical protein BRD55_12300 [Bacteroidetes bacterium SW_9_63_38]|nr:MAG: hypothetical protein BRD55_12300 [Bacteroidetes bacterium SW_9_63_38]
MSSSAMPTYEAIYENGHLEWIGDEPTPGRHRVQVRVLDSETNTHDRDEVRRAFEKARGAWGTNKSLDEVEAEIQELRDEWDRLN